MPGNGFNVTADIMPNIGITLDFKKGLHLGVEAGVDVYSKVGLSKDLFKFIAKGNELGEDIKVGIDGYADAFAFAGVDFGFNLKKFNIRFQPTLFASLLHVATNDAYVRVSNKEDDEFTYLIAVNGNMDVYSAIPMTSDLVKDPQVMLNQMMSQLGHSMGVDLGGQVSFKPFNILTVTGSARIPIYPSHLSWKTSANYVQEWPISIEKLTSGNKENSEEGDTETTTTEKTTPKLEDMFAEPETVKYYINRPMKLAISADFKPFSWLMSYYGTLGIGIKHPFAKNTDETYAYIDYLIGTKISFVNIISLYLSTERTDEIFKHKATLALNLRLVEIDAGVALESANIETSFRGSGVGAFITACIGF